MNNSFITYRSGYKYQLASDYIQETNIFPRTAVEDHEFVELSLTGRLIVRKGYAWDGPSGPVVDTRLNMRASLVHDAFYQLIRMRYLTIKDHKDKADLLFKKMCIEDGVSQKFAQIYYLGLKLGGRPSADPKNEKTVKRAPIPF
jgi:hypothetical protein